MALKIKQTKKNVMTVWGGNKIKKKKIFYLKNNYKRTKMPQKAKKKKKKKEGFVIGLILNNNKIIPCTKMSLWFLCICSKFLPVLKKKKKNKG